MCVLCDLCCTLHLHTIYSAHTHTPLRSVQYPAKGENATHNRNNKLYLKNEDSAGRISSGNNFPICWTLPKFPGTTSRRKMRGFSLSDGASEAKVSNTPDLFRICSFQAFHTHLHTNNSGTLWTGSLSRRPDSGCRFWRREATTRIRMENRQMRGERARTTFIPEQRKIRAGKNIRRIGKRKSCFGNSRKTPINKTRPESNWIVLREESRESCRVDAESDKKPENIYAQCEWVLQCNQESRIDLFQSSVARWKWFKGAYLM